MWDEKFQTNIEVGRGSYDMPEFIDGVTVQCKNCTWYGVSGHCGVMPSEVMSEESWCATDCPKQFFKPKV